MKFIIKLLLSLAIAVTLLVYILNQVGIDIDVLKESVVDTIEKFLQEVTN